MGNLQLRISVSNHCSGRTGNSCRRPPASRDSGWDFSDQKYHRQWTFQSVLLSPWKCLYWFSGWFMLHSRKTNCPSCTYKCIRAVLMFWLNRAVSLPVLPCLVPLGVEGGLCDIPNSHALVRSEYYCCFLLSAICLNLTDADHVRQIENRNLEWNYRVEGWWRTNTKSGQGREMRAVLATVLVWSKITRVQSSVPSLLAVYLWVRYELLWASILSVSDKSHVSLTGLARGLSEIMHRKH